MKASIDKKNYKIVNEIIRLYSDTELPSLLEKEVQHWLINDFHTQEKETALWNIWNNLSDTSKSEKRQAWKEIKKKVGIKQTRVSYFNTRICLQAAAVFIPLLLFSVILYMSFRGVIEVEEPARYVEQLTFTSGNEATSITLSDETEVWLNKQSELVHNEDRQVELKGEAVFNVKKVGEQKFVVRSEYFTATVTGTRFNIQAYPDTKTHVITLYEGNLEVEVDNTLIHMTAGEELVFNTERLNLTKQMTFKTGPDWNREYIFYEQLELYKIFEDLKERYNVVIEGGNTNLLNDTITLKLEGNPDIQEVMSLLSKINGRFNYTIEDEIIHIH